MCNKKQVSKHFVLLHDQNFEFKNMTAQMSHLSKCKNKFLYICLDASDGDIENEILAENEFCKVKMLGAKSAKELDDNDLKQADVVAVWHTINLDSFLLNRFTKPPKVIDIYFT